MISVEGLERRFGSLLAVHDLSFQVPPGTIYGLLGPNGAGKTTTVRILSGLIAPTAGTVQVGDLTLGVDNPAIRAMTGILTESPGLHDRLTARENLAYYGRLYGLTDAALRDAVSRYLEVVGLTDAADRKVAGFSGMPAGRHCPRLLHEPRHLSRRAHERPDPEAAVDPRPDRRLRDAGRSIIPHAQPDEAERVATGSAF
jgi:ABC-2 type transport system ATP-binding protein